MTYWFSEVYGSAFLAAHVACLLGVCAGAVFRLIPGVMEIEIDTDLSDVGVAIGRHDHLLMLAQRTMDEHTVCSI